MTITEMFQTKRCVFSIECFPPKQTTQMDKMKTTLTAMQKLNPDFISVTFGAGGSAGGVSTVDVADFIQNELHIPALAHLICMGNDEASAAAVLNQLDAIGVRDVLALRGDKSQNEKRFMPHPQGHSHAVDLVRQIADMNRGKFIDGEVEECHHSKFSIGVAGYPEVHAEARDITSDIARLRDKVDAGAEYVITQMFFDNAKYFDFVRRCREAGITVPIIPGIKPLSTLRHLEILPETFGVKLPEELVREVKAHPDGVREVGTEWAIAQSRELMAAGVPVLHYYTMSRTTNIQKIVKAVF